jgi:peptide/nickel transport system permease protein
MKRLAIVIPVLALIFLGLAISLAGFIGPYDPSKQDRLLPFAPPTRVHMIDSTGNFHRRPFVYALQVEPDGEYLEDRNQTYPVHVFMPGTPYKLGGLIATRVHLFTVEQPARLFLMGTDGYGRDQFSRVLQGGQISLAAGVLATTVSLIFALIIGMTAGLHGGWVDAVLMRTSEVFFALPWLYLLLAIRAVVPLDLEPRMAFLLIVTVVGAVGWARPARMVRGVVLSVKERNYVVVARGFGATNLYIVRRHLLPEAVPVLLTQAAILIPRYVLAEVTLSFLGLGVSEPVASWGNMLGELQRYHILVSYWWMLLPAVLLIPVFVLFDRLASSLQSHLQPNA